MDVRKLRNFDWGYPHLLLAALSVVLVVAFVIAASTSTTAFGAYNAAWDGAADLRSEADAVGAEGRVILNTTAYQRAAPNETMAVILSPDSGYTQSETARIRQFVQQGGTLLVAEDFGSHSNDLLTGVGATARVDGRLLRDERRYYRSPAMPLATNVSDSPLTAGVDQLTLNYGTVVQPGNATVLVRSSEFAYLDENQNAALDENETVRSWPVATVEDVGAGRVIVVSDPSLFINAMLDRAGNQAFVHALFAGHSQLLLDYSHLSGQPPLAVALLILRNSPLLQALLGLLGLGVVGASVRAPAVIQRVRDRRHNRAPGARADADALAAYLREQHPDWDEERIRRVITGVLARQENREDNE